MNQTLNECIMKAENRECNLRRGDIVDHPIVSLNDANEQSAAHIKCLAVLFLRPRLGMRDV